MPETTTTGGQSTRERILDAGITIWNDLDPTILLGGFTAVRVAEAAGVTRSTFYSYWPTTAEYITELVDHLATLDSTDYPTIVARAGLIEPPGSPVTDIPRRIVEDCAVHLEVAAADPSLGLRLAFLAKADRPEVADTLRDVYRRSDEAQFATFRQSLERWGRDIRAPFDEDRLKVVFSTLLEGMAARRRIDPERFPADLYGWALLPLLLMVTRRPSDDRTLLELADSLNGWPAAGITSQLRRQERHSEAAEIDIAPDSMRQITIAVRRLLSELSFAKISMSELAIVTGYSEPTLQQMYGSLAGVAMCIFFLNCFERYEAPTIASTAIERLRELIAINSDEVRRVPAMTQNMTLLLSGNAPRPRTDLINFDPRIEFDTCIAKVQAEGDLDPSIDPRIIGETLRRMILVEASPLTNPSLGSLDTVEVFLRGAGAPPATVEHSS